VKSRLNNTKVKTVVSHGLLFIEDTTDKKVIHAYVNAQ